LIDKFGNIIYPLFEQMLNLQNKNTNLRKTRNLLLPKLISGEIDIEKLEIVTEQIAA
jgi:type I restriction enzyme S subunit